MVVLRIWGHEFTFPKVRLEDGVELVFDDGHFTCLDREGHTLITLENKAVTYQQVVKLREICDSPIFYPVHNLLRHSWISGTTGSGKTSWIGSIGP